MKHSKRKQEIYAAAAKLFREKGYAATSVRDIAEVVGLEPSSLYSHIKSKEEILIEICQDCAAIYSDGLAKILESQASPVVMVDQLVDLHIDTAYSRPSSVTVFNDEWKHLPPDHLSTFLSNRKDYEDRFRNILRNGVEDKMFVAMSTSTAFNIIINSVKWLHFYAKKLTPEEYEQKRLDIKSFIYRGLVTSS